MIFAYVRVSTKEQFVERQIDSIKKYYPDIPDKNIFIEYDTGANSNRTVYLKLKKKLKPYDELVIHELDRISRKKDFIKEQLLFFQRQKIILRVLELPTTMHTYSEETKWVGEMINNIILEVYCTMAQQERERLSKRTKEGLEAARLRGRLGGRPRKEDENVKQALSLYRDGYTISEICKFTKTCKTCFYKHLRLQILALLEKGITDKDIIEKTGCQKKYLNQVKKTGMASYI